MNTTLATWVLVGVFAITASLAGTMRTEGLSQLNAYLVLNVLLTTLACGADSQTFRIVGIEHPGR